MAFVVGFESSTLHEDVVVPAKKIEGLSLPSVRNKPWPRTKPIPPMLLDYMVSNDDM
jgi:hypothetical protein